MRRVLSLLRSDDDSEDWDRHSLATEATSSVTRFKFLSPVACEGMEAPAIPPLTVESCSLHTLGEEGGKGGEGGTGGTEGRDGGERGKEVPICCTTSKRPRGAPFSDKRLLVTSSDDELKSKYSRTKGDTKENNPFEEGTLHEYVISSTLSSTQDTLASACPKYTSYSSAYSSAI